MVEFWQFVWVLIGVQMLGGFWLTFRLYPGTDESGLTGSGDDAV